MPAAPAPDLRDIAPPIDVFPYPPWMIAVAVIAMLVVLGLITFAIFVWLRRRPAPAPPSPRTIALRELENLRGQTRKLEPYAFSIAVSDVLRTFIGAEYGLHAREQTSPEFLAAISDSPKFSAGDRELLARFLERCDMIKFARIDASVADSEELLGSAISFVQGART